MAEREIRMIDIAKPEHGVEVSIRQQHGNRVTVWINVDGICRLRIGHVSSNLLNVEINGKQVSHRD